MTGQSVSLMGFASHSISRIRTFIAIIENGSLREASEKMDVDPSTVSRQLSLLEADLKCKLIKRSNRNIQPTKIGCTVYEHYKIVLEELQKVEYVCLGFNTSTKQNINITLPRAYGRNIAMPLIQSYLKQHPNIQINIDWSDLPRDMIKDNFDLGIRGGLLEQKTLVAQKLMKLNLCIIAGPQLIQQYGSPISFSDLTKLPWIKLRFDGWPRIKLPKFKEGYCFDINEIIEAPLEVNSQEAAIFAVSQGIGISIVEYVAALPYIDSGDLIELFPDSIEPIGHYWLYKPDGLWAQTHVRKFSGYLLKHLRGSQATI